MEKETIEILEILRRKPELTALALQLALEQESACGLQSAAGQ